MAVSPDYAIRVRNLGVRFWLRHQASPTVHSGIVRFIKGKAKPEEFWAFRNVTFDVQAGSVLGIIGSNGSGKSTMLRALARIYAPDEGEIMIRGRASSLITLGAGFQPNLSGMENVYYNGMLLGLSKQQIEHKLDEIIEFAELGKFITAPVRTYSSGMKARLGFSVAIHVDPEILIVDEVLAVGDAKFRKKCQAKFNEFFERGITTVMVQHNLDAIISLCKECLWLERGKQMMLGDPYQVVKAYLEFHGLPMIKALEGAAFEGDVAAPEMSGDGGSGSYGDSLL